MAHDKKSSKKKKSRGTIWLLYRDHQVISTDTPLRTLINKHAINKAVRWILIPIQGTKASYMPVDVATLFDLEFDRAEIRFRMRLKNCMIDMDGNVMDHDDWDESGPSDVMHEYYGNTIIATSYEELYSALYNIMFFNYFRSLAGFIDHPEDYPFLEVCELEISLSYKGRKTAHFKEDGYSLGVDKSPNGYTVVEAMATRIAKAFGFMVNDYLMTRDIVFYRDGCHSNLMWKLVNSPIVITQDLTHVMISAIEAHAVTLLPAKNYNSMVGINEASFNFTGFDLTYVCDNETEIKEMLPIACQYHLPKYQPRQFADDSSVSGNEMRLYEDMVGAVLFVNSVSITFCDELIFLLDNMRFVLQELQEIAHMTFVADQGIDAKTPDNIHPRFAVTVLAQLIVSLNPTYLRKEACGAMVMFTDSFEDYLPSVYELAILLEENQNSL